MNERRTRTTALVLAALSLAVAPAAFAQSADAPDVISLQPFGSIGLPNDWSIGLSDIIFTYDTRQGRFTSVPFGLRLEKFLVLGQLPARVYGDVEYGFLNGDLTPKWTFRFTFSPLL